MEDLKFFVPILREMLKENPSLVGAIVGSKRNVRRMLRKEAFNVSIRFMFGLIISAGVIYSLIRLLQELHFFLISTANGAINTSLFFAAFGGIGVFTLYLLFRTKSDASSDTQKQFENALEKLALNFIDGLLTGINKAKQTEPNKEIPK